MRPCTAARLAPLIAAQDGLVTTAQLTAAGLDRRLPARERWQALAPALWCTRGQPDDRLLVQAARLLAGPRAVVSGPSACRLLGLRDAPARPGADVLVPAGRRLTGGPLLRVRQTERLPSTLLPTVARAVADAVGWDGDLRRSRALVLAAVADGRVAVEELVEEALDGQRAGRRLLDRVLADARRGAASAPEAEAADALLALPRGALPGFVLNPVLMVDGRPLCRPDGYLPRTGIGWEVDSARHHGSSADLARTLDRHERALRAGVELVHVVPSVLRRDPGRWATGLAARVRERCVGDPPGLVVLTSAPW
jgi:hypothetical protein